MKRRTKRRKAGRAKFSFAQLEPRKLLAADGIFSATMGADFIGPVFHDSIEPVCVVQAESVSEATGTEIEVVNAEVLDDTDALKTELSEEQTEPNEETEETEEESLDEACTDQAAKANPPTANDDFDDNGIITITSQLFTVDLQEIAADSYLPGADGSTATFYRFTQADDISVLYNGTETPITVSIQQTPAEQALQYDTLTRASASTSDPIESNPLDNPVELTQEEGVFFNETVEATTETRNAVQTETDSAPRVGMLAQRQLFALISPSEIDRVELPGSTTAKIADPGSSLHSLATRTRSAPAIGNLQSSNLGNTSNSTTGPRSQGLPSLNVNTQFNLSSRSTRHVAPIGSNPTRSFVEEATVTGSPSVHRYSLLDRWFGTHSGNGQQPAGDHSAADQSQTNDQSDEDDSFARSVQIVESAIILIGLPSSRVFRDDESRNRSGV